MSEAASQTANRRPWPLELVFQGSDRALNIRFDDGSQSLIPFELLRIESPSAEVQGHSAAEKKIITGKEQVGVVRTEPVGRYAVRIIFDDGHDSGLFTWDWLYRLAQHEAATQLHVSVQS